MSKDAPPVISYMVARTPIIDGPSGPSEGEVEVVETCNNLLTANSLKLQTFMKTDTMRCWVERLEQKRIGEIMDKRKPHAG